MINRIKEYLKYRRNKRIAKREIARIATGEINDISIQHAKELRKEKVA